MLWSCQTSSTRKDCLDQYPILCFHAQNILGAKGLNWGLTRPRFFFRQKTDKFKSVVPRRNFKEATLGFSILQFAFQCYDIVEVIQYFQIFGIVCFLFIWTLQHWILCCPYLPIFGNRFVNIFSLIWSDHSLRSVVENSFAVSLMTTGCPCRWSW